MLLREKEDKKTRQDAILIVNQEQVGIINLVLETKGIKELIETREKEGLKYKEKMKSEGKEKKYFDTL